MGFILKGATLSNEGIAKLNNFVNIAQQKVSDALRNIETDLKDNIEKYAPAEGLELEYLALPGTTYNIFKDGFVSLKEAIRTEEIPILVEAEGIVKAYYGNVETMSPKIGFAWFKGKHGNSERRSTADGAAGEAWGELLRRWEFGGSAFTVVSRDGDTMNILYKVGGWTQKDSVDKQIPPATVEPFRMYSRGGTETQDKLIEEVKRTLKLGVVEAGFGSN